MGRKNNKNRYRNQNQYNKKEQVKTPERENVEVIGTGDNDIIIEVIEPTMPEQPTMPQQPVPMSGITENEKIGEKKEEMVEKEINKPIQNGPQVQTQSQQIQNQQVMPQMTQTVPQQVMYQQMPYGVSPQQGVYQQMPQMAPTPQQGMYQQMPQMAPTPQQSMNTQMPYTTIQNGPQVQPVKEPQTSYQNVMQPVVEQPSGYQAPVEEIKTATEENFKPAKKIELLITKNPKSSFSESIKSIRTNLQFASVEKEIKVILVSSPEPGDGKSLISSNLAGAYAQENKRVLIIDCDLRKGRQAEIFKVQKLPTTGYTNLILNYEKKDKKNDKKDAKKEDKKENTNEEKFSFEDYICETGIENMDLIPNGPTPPNPIELLSSSKNKELLDELKEMYDVIILDCPPVLGLSDALIMTKYSDANIIVISKGKTKIESLAEVKKNFEKVNSTITGVITNKAKAKHNSYYGYYGE